MTSFLTMALVTAVCLSYPPWRSAGYWLLVLLLLAYPYATFGLLAVWFFLRK